MSCQRCGSIRVAGISSKSSDLNAVHVGTAEHVGYVPEGFGIGGGDYIEFEWCLECGQIQGKFPLPPTSLETGVTIWFEPVEEIE